MLVALLTVVLLACRQVGDVVIKGLKDEKNSSTIRGDAFCVKYTSAD